MDKKEIKEFFDKYAPTWDEEMIKDDSLINLIMDGAEINEGKDILDVACGTGVLFPYYLDRHVNSITGVDISPEMIRITQKKFPDGKISLICADIEESTIMKDFDCIMVYNAFPHFPSPERVVFNLCQMLKDGGTLTIAHGMSKEKLNEHHSGSAKNVSVELMDENVLAELMSEYLDITVKIADDKMYQVTGKMRT